MVVIDRLRALSLAYAPGRLGAVTSGVSRSRRAGGFRFVAPAAGDSPPSDRSDRRAAHGLTAARWEA